MATNIGSLEFSVDADGTLLLSQIKRIGRQAGLAGGNEFNKSFRKTVQTQAVRDLGTALANVGRQAMRSVPGLRRMNRSLVDISSASRSIGSSFRDLQGAMRGIGAAFSRTARASELVGTAWEGLSRGDLTNALADLRVQFEGNEEAILRNDEATRSMVDRQRDLQGTIAQTQSRLAEYRGSLLRLNEDIDANGKATKDQLAQKKALRRIIDELRVSMDQERATLAQHNVEMARTADETRRLRDRNTALTNNIKLLGRELVNLDSPMRRLGTSLRRSSGDVNRNALSWRGLGRALVGSRIRLIVTAIIAALAQTAVLGSAVGGSIFILASAFAALGAAAGIAVAGFAGLNAEWITLNADAKATKDAFAGLVDVFKGLQQVVVDNMFGGMADSVARFGDALKGIEGPLATFSQAVGAAISGAFDRLASDEAISGISRLLDGMSRVIGPLVDSLLSFAGALGEIIIIGLGPAERFAEAIQDIGQSFLDWTLSDDGRARIEQWFSTAERIMPQVVDLFAAAGGALAGIVTEETISGLESLIGSLTNAMPAVEGFLEAIGHLNIFGILAAAIDAIFTAIEPLIPALQTFGSGVFDFLVGAFETLAPILATVASALAPLVEGIGQFLGFLGENMGVVTAIVIALGSFAGVVAVVANIIGVFNGLATVIGVVRGAWAALSFAFSLSPIGLIITAVAALVAGLVYFFTQTKLGKEVWANIVAFIQDAVGWIGEAIGNIGEWFADVWANVTDGVDAFFGWWNGVWEGFGQIVSDTLSGIGRFFTDLWNGIVDGITGFFDFWFDFWATLLAPVIEFLQPMFDAFATIFQGIVNIVTGVFNIIVGLIQIFVGLVALGFQELGNFFRDLWNGFVDIVTTAWNAVVEYFTPAVEAFVGFFTDIFDELAKKWDATWAVIQEVVTIVWEAIVAYFTPAVEAFVEFFTTIFDEFARWWNDLWAGAKAGFTIVWDAIKAYVGAVIDGINTTIRDIFDGFTGWWKGIWDGVSAIFSDIWNGIRDTAKTVINNIIDIINGIIRGLNAFGDAFGVHIDLVPRLAKGGIAWNSMLANIGEDGPEAVVPLRRPLSQVDPSVRELSAIAQGRSAGSSSGSAAVGSGARVVNINENAIQIVAPDPWRAATETVNRITERTVA